MRKYDITTVVPNGMFRPFQGVFPDLFLPTTSTLLAKIRTQKTYSNINIEAEAWPKQAHKRQPDAVDACTDPKDKRR